MSSETTKSTHGGRRPGSGKKPLIEGQTLKPVSIKLSDAQKDKLGRLGGAPWVREKIDKAKEPPKK